MQACSLRARGLPTKPQQARCTAQRSALDGWPSKMHSPLRAIRLRPDFSERSDSFCGGSHQWQPETKDEPLERRKMSHEAGRYAAACTPSGTQKQKTSHSKDERSAAKPQQNHHHHRQMRLHWVRFTSVYSVWSPELICAKLIGRQRSAWPCPQTTSMPKEEFTCRHKLI
jgi:hypothetical protein